MLSGEKGLVALIILSGLLVDQKQENNIVWALFQHLLPHTSQGLATFVPT